MCSSDYRFLHDLINQPFQLHDIIVTKMKYDSDILDFKYSGNKDEIGISFMIDWLMVASWSLVFPFVTFWPDNGTENSLISIVFESTMTLRERTLALYYYMLVKKSWYLLTPKKTSAISNYLYWNAIFKICYLHIKCLR